MLPPQAIACLLKCLKEHHQLKKISKDLRHLSEKQDDLAARLRDSQAAHQAAIRKHAQADLDLQELLDAAAKSSDAKVDFAAHYIYRRGFETGSDVSTCCSVIRV